MPNSPEEKFWIAVEYSAARIFLTSDGEFWTRAVVFVPGGILEQPSTRRSETNESDDADAFRSSSCPRTLQFGYSSNSGWDAALIVRNLFDEAGVGYLSTTDYGRIFRR